MKSFNQVTRHKIFSVIDTMLKTQFDYLKSISNLFIETYIHLTSGEKDPRNLMISFGISAVILENFDVSKFSDDLFDVTFCYFPITFEPPKNDPYGITSDDLRKSLRRSISANGSFAKDAFPGLLEKLTSSSYKIKSDTLVTIAMCVKRYEPDTVAPYWRELWDGLKFEVIHGSEENTPELTLDVLRELASTLSRASDQANYESYLEAVITETKENITEIQNKKALPSIRLASGIAASSESVFNKISQAILTTILDASVKSPTIAAQRIILEMIGCFVKSSINFFGENLLVPYKDSILEFYSKSLMGAAKIELTLRISAIQHLSELTTVKNLLSSEEVGLIVQYLNDVLLDDNKQELKEEALKALVVISDLNVEHILTLSFPALLARLPDTESTTEEGLKEIEDILYSLAHITVSRSTLEALSVRLLNKLDVVLRNNCTANYPLAIFTTLLSVVAKLSDKPEEDISILIIRLIPEIFTRFIENYEKNKHGVLFENSVLQTASILIMLIIRAADVQKQTQFVENLFKTFWLSESSKLITSKFFNPLSFAPFAPNSEPTNITMLFTAALAPIKKDVSLTVPAMDIINRVVEITGRTTDPALRLNYLRLISLVVNKWVPAKSDEIKVLADNLVKNFSSKNPQESLGSLEVFTWITKAFVIKADAYGFEFTKILIELLADPKLGGFVSKALDIVGDDDAIFSKENNSVIRLLYKQRYFTFVLDPLVNGFKSHVSSPDIQANYLVAMSGVLRHMPPKVISNDVPTFFPLLLQSLVIKDSKVREASISTITATLHESSEVVAQHLSSLIPQLLAAASEKTSSSSKVRIAALNCLGEFPSSIPRKDIESFRLSIIKRLSVPLDDKKRDVRRAAVNARQKYFELNAAE